MTEENNESQPEEKTQPTLAEKLREMLAEFPSAPSVDEIEMWKSRFNDVFASAFSEEEFFVFRPLNRKEYRELQASAKDEADFEEAVINCALLWSSVNDLNKKAGTIPSLLEQIMQNSNFMPPHVASTLVVKL